MKYAGKSLIVIQEYLQWYFEQNGVPSVFTVGEHVEVIDAYPSTIVISRKGKRYRIPKYWFKPMYTRWLELEILSMGRRRGSEYLQEPPAEEAGTQETPPPSLLTRRDPVAANRKADVSHP